MIDYFNDISKIDESKDVKPLGSKINLDENSNKNNYDFIQFENIQNNSNSQSFPSSNEVPPLRASETTQPNSLTIQMFELGEVKHQSYYGYTRECIYKPKCEKLYLICIQKINSLNSEMLRKQFSKNFRLDENLKICGLVKIKAIFEDSDSFYICTDIPKGNNLLEHLENAKMNEKSLIQLVKRMFPIIKLGIVDQYRLPSISLENIFYDYKEFELYDYGKFLYDSEFFYYENTLNDIIYFSPSFLRTKTKTES